MTVLPALPGVQLLLVDLDGPLVRLLPHPDFLTLTDDVRDVVARSGTQVWPELASLTDHVAALREIARRLPADVELLRSAAARAGEVEVSAAERQPAYPGAVGFVRAWLAGGRPLAVVTNNDVKAAAEVLRRAGLDGYLDAGLLTVHGRVGSAVGGLKPAPDLLLAGLAAHDVARSRAVMVGDMASDVQAARAAGVRAVGVSADADRARELREAGALAVVPALEDLTGVDRGVLAEGGASVTPSIERVTETVLPTRHGPFRMLGYRDQAGTAHVALVRGLESGPNGHAPLVRVHSECLTGDGFGSRRCDCGEQLQAALARVAAEGEGVVLYVRGHEGRGIGLLDKLRAYHLQDEGADTVDANLALGLEADLRTYDQAALMLADLGIATIRLMSSNPAKEEALRDLGVDVVERTRLPVPDRPENHGYLTTKRQRMRHDTVLETDVWTHLREGSVPTGMLDPLLDRYGPLVGSGPTSTIAQLGQSLDGFIAARSGDAEFVTGEEDREHLHRLRALVDAVVVGAGTVAADDPQLTVRAVPGENPVRVVLDPRARIPRTSRVLTDGQATTLWLVGPTAASVLATDNGVFRGGSGSPASEPGTSGVEILTLSDDGDADPGEVLALLHGRGLGRVLVEGGGRVVSSFFAAGVLDRLYLTTAPLLIGDGIPGLRFEGSDVLTDAVRGRTRRFALGDDICTEVVLRRGG